MCVLLALLSAGCGVLGEKWEEPGNTEPATTYRKFLARAEAGHAESQNVVGFMLFHGEGVRMDQNRARTWFEKSAVQGNSKARRNLAQMESIGTSETVLATERRRSQAGLPAPHPGQPLYEKFCAGCHGFNGISAYVRSPSFALGEAVDKDDANLLVTLLRGKGEMPNWDDKFSYGQLVDVLRFVRTLPGRYEQGVGQSLRPAPPVFYLFGPMKPEERAFRERLRDYGIDEPANGK